MRASIAARSALTGELTDSGKPKRKAVRAVQSSVKAPANFTSTVPGAPTFGSSAGPTSSQRMSFETAPTEHPHAAFTRQLAGSHNLARLGAEQGAFDLEPCFAGDALELRIMIWQTPEPLESSRISELAERGREGAKLGELRTAIPGCEQRLQRGAGFELAQTDERRPARCRIRVVRPLDEKGRRRRIRGLPCDPSDQSAQPSAQSTAGGREAITSQRGARNAELRQGSFGVPGRRLLGRQELEQWARVARARRESR